MNKSDFRDLREQIEKLSQQINKCINEKSIYDSSEKLEEANSLLTSLRDIAKNDVQERAVSRLSNDLEYLATKIDDILSKREAGKKGDGNVAFKCNWNDKGYKAPCSDDVYRYNISEGRAWCSSPSCECRKYGADVSLDDHPCYESIALKDMYFGAGWDHTGEREQPRHIHNVKKNRMAILTTRPPDSKEKDRLIIGCIFIDDVRDDPGEETKIYGNKTKSIELPFDDIKIKYWDYYKNPEAEDIILWSSGLFRYVSNKTVLSILRAIGEKYTNEKYDVKKIHALIKYYEKLKSNQD